MKKVLAAIVAAVMIFGLGVPSALAATTDEDGVTVVITPEETTEEQNDQSPDTDETNDEATDEAGDETTEETEDEATDGDGEEDSDGQTDEEQETILTPDSPFYFLKRFVESVKLFLTFDEEKKVQLLAELADERAKELEALQQKYDDGELTEAQFELLEKALDDLVLSTERLVNSLVPEETEEQDGEETQDPDSSEDGDTNTDEDAADDTEDEESTDDEDDEATDDEDDEATDDEDDEATDDEDEEYGDKYLRRVAHLQRIADCAPEAAQKGLARAIANALRQRERAIAKGRIVVDPVEETEDEAADDEDEEETTPPADEETDDTTATTSSQLDVHEDDEPEFGDKDWSEKVNGNRGRGPSKTSPGKGKGKKNKGK